MITVKFAKEAFFPAASDIARLRDPAECARRARALLAEGGYEDAAEVATDDPEHAYTLMQNGGPATDSWTLQAPPGLRPLLPPHNVNGRLYGQRSASMGDVFVTGDGSHFLCVALGFAKI